LSKACSRRRKQKGKAQEGPSIIGCITEMRGIMTVCVVQLARFIIRTILAVALTFACLNSGIAQAQELTTQQPSAAENDPPSRLPARHFLGGCPHDGYRPDNYRRRRRQPAGPSIHRRQGRLAREHWPDGRGSGDRRARRQTVPARDRRQLAIRVRPSVAASAHAAHSEHAYNTLLTFVLRR